MMSSPSDLAAPTVPSSSPHGELQAFETGLVRFIQNHGLPAADVLVSVPERVRVFGNIEPVLARLKPEQIGRSHYVSKFLAAAAAGLFDAALNYLWDETVSELRRRVARYDLSYFFDVAVKSPDKRSKLKTEDDLARVDDFDLINGANEIGLVSDIGLRHLDYIRYMRNWASAAHPNHNNITGLQLISWLETCVTEVINLPEDKIVVEIKKLLSNVRNTVIDPVDAPAICTFFADLTSDRVDSLAAGFFGIYVAEDAAPQSRQNVRLLFPRLWPRVSVIIRKNFGVRYAQFLANGETARQKLAREVIDAVGGAEYLPDGVRAAEVENAVRALLTAHNGRDNFYNEPPLAKQLAIIVGDRGLIPLAVRESYVLGLMQAALSNGNGIAWNAEPIYFRLISLFDPEMATLAMMSFEDRHISIRLQYPRCKEKWYEIMNLVLPKITAPAAQELASAMLSFTGPLDRMRLDAGLRDRAAALRNLLGLAPSAS